MLCVVVGASDVYSIVAAGHSCVPAAAACVVSGSDIAAFSCVTDARSTGDIL